MGIWNNAEFAVDNFDVGKKRGGQICLNQHRIEKRKQLEKSIFVILIPIEYHNRRIHEWRMLHRRHLMMRRWSCEVAELRTLCLGDG